MNEVLSGASSVFLETSVLIYYIEEHAEFFPAVAEVVDAVDRGEKSAISSHVALFEVLSKPFELGRDDLVQRYKSLLLGHPHVRIVPIGAEIAVEAARIRATYRLKKAPDALQLATAKLHGAEAFLTNDVELKRFDEIPVVVLKDCL